MWIFHQFAAHESELRIDEKATWMGIDGMVKDLIMDMRSLSELVLVIHHRGSWLYSFQMYTVSPARLPHHT